MATSTDLRRVPRSRRLRAWGRGGPAGALWPPAASGLLALSLAALAAGAVPEAFLPSQVTSSMTLPPALHWLLAGQAAILLLLAPPLLMPRVAGVSVAAATVSPVSGRTADSPSAEPPSFSFWPLAAVGAGRIILLLIVSAPLYGVAAKLSDVSLSRLADCLLDLLAVAAAAWGLGLWWIDAPASSPRDSAGPAVAPGAAPADAESSPWLTLGRTAALVLALSAALAAPAAHYLVREFAGQNLSWLAQASPTLFLLDLPDRLASVPLWPSLLWPVVGLASLLARLSVAPLSHRASTVTM